MELANILSECLRNSGSWNPKTFPGEACPRPLWRSFRESASIYPIDPRLKGIVSAVAHLNFPPFTFLFSVFFSFPYLLFGTLLITRTMLAQSSLLRKLGKIVMPVFLRKKHDYFPRTLKLHNGKKVRNVNQKLLGPCMTYVAWRIVFSYTFFWIFILKCYALI